MDLTALLNPSVTRNIPDPIELVVKDSLVSNNSQIYGGTKYIEPISLKRFTTEGESLKRFSELYSLSDGWAGDKTVKPSKKALFNAISFFYNLSESLKSQLDPEDITPTPYGTIVLEFENREYLYSIEFGDSKIGYFLKKGDEYIDESNDIRALENTIPSKIYANFDEFFGQK